MFFDNVASFAHAHNDVEVYQEAHLHHQEDEEGRLHREEVGVETYTHTLTSVFLTSLTPNKKGQRYGDRQH